MASAGSLGISPRAFELSKASEMAMMGGSGGMTDGRHTGALIRSIRYPNAPSPMPVLGASAKFAARGMTPSPTPGGGGGGGGQLLTPGGPQQQQQQPPPPPQHSPGRRDTSPPRDASGNYLNNYLFRQTFSPRKLPPDTPVVGRPGSLLQALPASSSTAAMAASDGRRVVVHNAFGEKGPSPATTPQALARGLTPSSISDVRVTSRGGE